MKKCKVSNYSKDKYSNLIDFAKIKASTVEDLIEEIYGVLKGLPFSTNIEDSLDTDTYAESINDLCEQVKKELAKTELASTLSPADKGKITRSLKEKLLPTPLTKVEQQISAIIKGTDLVREEDVQAIRYHGIISDFYGSSNPGLDNLRLSLFESELGNIAIYNKKIVETDKELNQGIMDYLEKQYQIIRKYLTDYHFSDDSNFPKVLFTSWSENRKIKVKTHDYFNTITAMYNVIQHLKEDNSFQDYLEDGWNKTMDNSTESSKGLDIYNAISAYINLVYFDATLKQVFSKFININNQQEVIQIAVDEFDHATEIYKYTRSVGNANARKTWGDDISNSLEEMSKFHQVLIRRIPLYDYKTEEKEYGTLEPKDVVGAFTLLKVAGALVKDAEFRTAIENLNNDNSRKKGDLFTIFHKLFVDKNQNIIHELNNRGLDQNYLNIIYSVYQTVFSNSKNSWKSIENNFLKEKGIHSRYNMAETILNVIKSNTILSYLQTTYNYDNEQMVTAIKERYSYSKTKFDIIHDIDDNTIQREDTKELLTAFPLNKLNDGKSYSIKIGENVYNIVVTGDNVNILSKKNSASNFDISELAKIKDVECKTNSQREHLLSGQNLTDSEKQFMEVLSFIDTMLNTTFSVSSQSLEEFHLSRKNRPNFFHNLFMSAARALVIQDIYKDFRTAKKENGDTYAKNELKDYLNDSNKFPGIVGTNKDYYYFIKTIEGNQLKTLDNNEQWVIDLAKVRAILNRDTVNSTISDLTGNKNPNFSLAYLSGDLKGQLLDSKKDASATSFLLFSDNRSAIIESPVDLDVAVKNRKSKQVKSFTETELFYHALVNKFLIPFSEDGTIFIQSTTQSDKTKFIPYHINLNDIVINGVSLSQIVKTYGFENSIINAIQSTIGQAYKHVYNSVLEDYQKLFPSIKTIDDVNQLFKGKPVKLADSEDVYIISDEKSLMNAVRAYNKNHPRITIYKDLHYRQIKGGKLAFNELLYEFSQNLYNDTNYLKQRLDFERKRFLKDLIKRRMNIKATPQIKNILVQSFGVDLSRWVQTIGKEEYVVLAKSNGQNVFTLKDIGEDITLNPFLNAYFLIDNLVGNNLRFSGTGSEINHKIKALGGLDLKSKINANIEDLLLLKPNYIEDNLTFYDLDQMIKKGRNIPELSETVNELKKVYSKQILLMENLGQGAQFKRNVIMSATMQRICPSLEGISEMLNVACISDVTYNIFNFSGKTDKLKVHDGSALISPLESILENKSLGSNEVGSVKKPIQHSFNNKYMTATLLKYATDTITNQWMRQSVGNDLNNNQHAINLLNLFKKMHNKRWHKLGENGEMLDDWVDGEIDLINGCAYKKDEEHEILFKDDILQGHDLFYRKGGKHYKIENFGRENGIYYTVESEVDFMGNALSGERGRQHKVYHYFDSQSNHIPSQFLLEGTTNHTIDSLYELHTALGGIWSEAKNEDRLNYSESSNIVVVNFINYVATLKQGADPTDYSINSYDQPLKRAMIHVVANDSAVKNGVGNINDDSVWYNDSDLEYMQIDSKMYGIQQDSDHTADEAHMTEFSQVISSLDAGGYLHDYVSQIYQQLGQVAIDLSSVELDAVDKFRESGNLSDLYDIVGRTIIANIKSGRNQVGLAQAIINNIKSKFNLNIDHSLDDLKIPFSDPNIYSNILSSFVSNINKKSIKRQFPGLGTVMVPSFNISMIYDINGITYQFEDIIKEAQENGITSTEIDNTKYNQDIAKQYLNKLQEKEQVTTDINEFYPTDNVLVTILGTKNGETKEYKEHVSLNGIEDYYNFTDNPVEYLTKKGYSNITNLTYQKDLTVPRNLAPARITWDYIDSDGKEHHCNIFNHWRVRGQIREFLQIQASKGSKEEKNLSRKLASKKWDVDQAFKDLKKGIYEPYQGASPVQITNLKNDSAEIIMSNIYASKFNIKKGDSLVDVLKQGEAYFSVPEVNLESDKYDMVFTKGDGSHDYITFKPLSKNDDNCSTFYQSWENINKVSYEAHENVQPDSPQVINKIYAVTSDNVRLFEIGREIVNDDVVWDSAKKAFIQDGKKVSNQRNFRRDGDRVLEYIEFVSKHQVSETRGNGSVISYNLYNINKNNLRRCFEKEIYPEKQLHYKNSKGIDITLTQDQKYDQSINYYISNLLANIYKARNYSGIQFNKSMSDTSGRIVKRVLYNFAENLKYNKPLYDYLNNVRKIIDNIEGEFKIPTRALKKAERTYSTTISHKQYVSFQKSLYFTAARIPAQTLQSFMKQKCVGFTGTDTGQCFVSAWQTFLQGSDYKQNCSL